MAVETEADRDAMLADFGIDVTSGQNTFKAIFDHEYVELLGIDGEVPTLLCKASVVGTLGIIKGSDLTVEGVNYKMRTPKPDGTGFTLLVIEEQ